MHENLLKVLMSFFLSVGFWCSWIFEIPGSSNWAGHCVSELFLTALPYSSPFMLILLWNVNYASGTNCLSLRFFFFSVKSRGGSSPSQHHQSAAKDLTCTTEPASSSSSPTQTTYLAAAVQQRSKRPRHFLELKNFKDNYNTLDSSFWKSGMTAPPPQKKLRTRKCWLKCLWTATGHCHREFTPKG